MSVIVAPAAAVQSQSVAAEPTAAENAAPDFSARASELMASFVPRVAQRAERAVSRTLFLAGRSRHLIGDDEVWDSAVQIGRGPIELPPVDALPRAAENLGAAARSEFGRHGASREVIQLQARAFGANPTDAGSASYLAYLLVRQRPAQPEAARQLALYALTMRGGRGSTGRPEDWATLAVANALLGREREAENALLVSLAVTPNVERQCRAALDLYATYGERMRGPAEAMLRTARAGIAPTSAACDWPGWQATTR
ncbi:MAG: hypothetical protein M3Z16_03350 [Pseudomonadota bacterium]|nr:hypothetical protein [Pseudomonadota bacterium]